MAGFGNQPPFGFGFFNIPGQQNSPDKTNNPSANTQNVSGLPFSVIGQPNYSGTNVPKAEAGVVGPSVFGVNAPTPPSSSFSPAAGRPASVNPTPTAAPIPTPSVASRQNTPSSLLAGVMVAPGRVGRKMGEVHEVKVKETEKPVTPPVSEKAPVDVPVNASADRPGNPQNPNAGGKQS